ncbi:hypothetical protein [Corallococcus carmarthensis]|uniref:Uncharacterized protein n=1 Tax=Corallococcus carmarthensis TaxID=2316728 RepID=A0A3A8KD20_9BACT|nr:hypothetical protein [Corallococcus carmarthensis]NOK17576.1 hypothetical protein [Corallococcus carmarthensis]RKH00342.1 hypothetical protein D7X32_23705 [Corallococcus carmarthensis]
MIPFSRTLVVLNLMFFGAGLALFVQGQRASASAEDVQARLERMEGRLNQVLAQRQSPAVALPGAPALPADLDARMEQAVTRALQAQAANVAPREDTAPREPHARNASAWSRGNEVVDRALSARRWGDEQARELSASMPSLTQQQQVDLLRRLSVAINEGQLKVETHGPLF